MQRKSGYKAQRHVNKEESNQCKEKLHSPKEKKKRMNESVISKIKVDKDISQKTQLSDLISKEHKTWEMNGNK